MSVTIPTPAALAQRFIAALAQQSFVASDGSTVRLDATAAGTFENVFAVLRGLSDYELYLFIRDMLLELMVTTATETGLLPQHAALWKTPRIGPTAAVGNVLITASTAVTVPAGTILTTDGTAQWTVDTTTSVPAGATVVTSITCTSTGVTGNVLGNTALTVVTPIAGITSVFVDQNGCTGGAPIEDVEIWRSRILASIRRPPGAGTVTDYQRWMTGLGATVVKVVPGYTGVGTVGIIYEMLAGTAPTAAQVAAMQQALSALVPVRANATVYASQPIAQNLTIRLGVNTVANQAAVQTALAPLFLSVGIGGLVSVEQIQSAIYQTIGGTNVLVSPTQDITLSAPQRPILGVITWSTGS